MLDPGVLEALKFTLAHPKQDHQPLGDDPPRGEQQRIGRWHVQPLRIVDQAHDRPCLGRGGQQRQRARGDQKPIVAFAVGHPERRAERAPLRRG